MGSAANSASRGLIESNATWDGMTSLATTQRGERLAQPVSAGVSRATGLLRRDDLLASLDRAVTRKVTIISAPPGSGKTSLLRTWSDRSSNDRRVAFVSVPRDQQDAQQFWLARSGCDPAIGRHARFPNRKQLPPEFDGDAMVDTVVSELAEQAESSCWSSTISTSCAQLTPSRSSSICSRAAEPAHVVLSSRRDPPIRLHQLRLADEVAEIRAGDLRFTERETRELLAASGIVCPTPGRPRCASAQRVGRLACAWR